MGMSLQVLSLFILALPIASIAWTITHEDLTREFREACREKSEACRRIYQQKFFYLFTCEYCLSHYVTAIVLLVTHYKLLYPDWRGYVVAGFSLVWVANIYMSLFARIRLVVKRERVEIGMKESHKAPEEQSSGRSNASETIGSISGGADGSHSGHFRN
jgi:hypothetical protein